ncbi:class I glutamine amidotransferase-like protein [Atractiella rhizophila]|nr:class I glutamine amidotransferase-like protein [Atractiella rhizophila]
MSLPKRYGIILFKGFEPLDAFGPLGILKHLPDATLSVIAKTLEPVSSSVDGVFEHKTVPTHTFDSPPELDVLIIPGGRGTRVDLVEEKEYIKKAYPRLQYVFTVCTGSVLLAQTGLLDGKRATSNILAWPWVTSHKNVEWVRKARWVVDGNIYTTSGVTAGMDGILGFISDIHGIEEAQRIAKGLEYVWANDPANDPFA